MTTPRSVPPESRRPPADDAADRGSRVLRFGSAVTAVLLSSVIATLPAAVRMAPSLTSACGRPAGWLALLALAFGPVAVATVALRHALGAVRLFDPGAVAAGAATAVLWCATSIGAFTVIGAFLRATTHHHGLAGVTFACAGVVTAALLALVSVRLVTWARAASPVLRWTVLLLGVAGLGAALAAFVRLLGHGDGAPALATDLLALVVAAIFGAGAFPRRSRPSLALAVAGPPLAAVVLVLGCATLRASPQLRAAVQADAPVLGSVVVLSGVRDATPTAAH
jgi:hypothetical protein